MARSNSNPKGIYNLQQDEFTHKGEALAPMAYEIKKVAGKPFLKYEWKAMDAKGFRTCIIPVEVIERAVEQIRLEEESEKAQKRNKAQAAKEARTRKIEPEAVRGVDVSPVSCAIRRVKTKRAPKRASR